MYIQKIYIFLIRAINRLYPWFPEKISLVTRESFIASSKKYLWMKYVLGWDGKGDNGIDCSHLVCAAMIDAGGAQKYFHRTAHDLHRLSQKISLEEMMPWDLIFWPDGKERMEHVAIFLSKWENSLNIIDASGPSSGLWSTTERTIEFQEFLSFGRPPFFSPSLRTEPNRLAEIKSTYEEGAQTFTHRTSDENVSQSGGTIAEARDMFLNYLNPNSLILDVGCGPGRDSKYFLEQWHRVVGIDICETFISDLAQTTQGEFVVGDIVDSEQPVYQKKYDGIWACASLVHLSREESVQTIKNCFSALRDGWCFFIGIKYDEGQTRMAKKESVSIPWTFKTYLFYNEWDLKSDLESQWFTILDSSIAQWPYGGDRFIQILTRK